MEHRHTFQIILKDHCCVDRLCFLAYKINRSRGQIRSYGILSGMTNALFCDTIMPNKYAEKKEWNVPKQKYKLSNWSEYSDALRRRGEIDVWLSEEAMALFPNPSPLSILQNLGGSIACRHPQ